MQTTKQLKIHLMMEPSYGVMWWMEVLRLKEAARVVREHHKNEGQ